MSDQIKEALAKLDPNDDAHWTDAGAPSVAAMKELTGNASLTRSDITAALPDGFDRDNTTLQAEANDANADQATDEGHASDAVVTEPAREAVELEPEYLPEAVNLRSDGDAQAFQTTLGGNEPYAAALAAVEGSEGDEALAMLDAAIAACSHPRFIRNNPLQNVIRAYQIEQNSIKDLQARLDAREDYREKRREQA